MANTYISFLGTNDYIPCTYVGNNSEVKNIRFVQEATIKINCDNWDENDRIMIFTTDEAYQKNWLDNGHIDYKTGEPLERDGLFTCLKKINLKANYQNVNIPSGNNEQEIWEIFRIVYDRINECDSIIFDITHAFRSIPMLAIIILNYAKVMKDVSLNSIYYGAFEVLGSIHKAKEIEPEKRKVPIIDLTAFDQLLEWSSAVDQFVNAGNAGPVGKLAEMSARKILSQTKGKELWPNEIRSLGKNIQSFTLSLATCRFKDIKNNIEKLKDNIVNCTNLELMHPFRPVFERIKKHIDTFNGTDEISDGFKAAKWCFEHNLIQQSITILLETMISYSLNQLGKDYNNFTNRKIVNQSIKILTFNLPEYKWAKEAIENKELTDELISFYKKNEILKKNHDRLTTMRNDINHCGMRDSPINAQEFEKKINIIFNEFMEINLL